MTRPETCDAAGGAISLWMKVTDCPPYSGIVSSIQFSGTTGSHIYCSSGSIWYDILPIFPHKLENRVLDEWSSLADLLIFDAIII